MKPIFPIPKHLLRLACSSLLFVGCSSSPHLSQKGERLPANEVSVAHLEPEKMEMPWSIPLRQTRLEQNAPHDSFLASDQKSLWVYHPGSHEVQIFDTPTGEMRSQIFVPTEIRMARLAPNGDLLVLDRKSQLLRIDVPSKKILQTLSLTVPDFDALVALPHSQKVILLHSNRPSLLIDPLSLKVEAELSLPATRHLQVYFDPKSKEERIIYLDALNSQSLKISRIFRDPHSLAWKVEKQYQNSDQIWSRVWVAPQVEGQILLVSEMGELHWLDPHTGKTTRTLTLDPRLWLSSTHPSAAAEFSQADVKPNEILVSPRLKWMGILTSRQQLVLIHLERMKSQLIEFNGSWLQLSDDRMSYITLSRELRMAELHAPPAPFKSEVNLDSLSPDPATSEACRIITGQEAPPSLSRMIQLLNALPEDTAESIDVKISLFNYAASISSAFAKNYIFKKESDLAYKFSGVTSKCGRPFQVPKNKKSILNLALEILPNGIELNLTGIEVLQRYFMIQPTLWNLKAAEKKPYLSRLADSLAFQATWNIQLEPIPLGALQKFYIEFLSPYFGYRTELMSDLFFKRERNELKILIASNQPIEGNTPAPWEIKQGIYIDFQSHLRLEHMQPGLIEQAYHWKSGGKIHQTRVRLQLGQSNSYLPDSSSPRYETWLKDGWVSGAVLFGSNLDSEMEFTIKQYLRFLKAQNCSLSQSQHLTQTVNWLIDSISNERIDWWINESHILFTPSSVISTENESIARTFECAETKNRFTLVFPISRRPDGSLKSENELDGANTGSNIASLSTTDFSDAIRKRKSELIYVNSSCSSCEKTLFHIASSGNKNHVELCSHERMLTFMNRPSHPLYQVVLGIFERKNLKTLDQELKQREKEKKDHYSWLIPGSDAYQDRLGGLIPLQLDYELVVDSKLIRGYNRSF